MTSQVATERGAWMTAARALRRAAQRATGSIAHNGNIGGGVA